MRTRKLIHQVQNIDPTTFVYHQRPASEKSQLHAGASHPSSLITIHPRETTVSVPCPACDDVFPIPVIGPPEPGRGFIAGDMDVQCPSCGFHVTHEKLRFARMVRDLADFQKGRIPYVAGLGPDDSILPPLLLDGSETLSRALITAIEESVFRGQPQIGTLKALEVGNLLNWSMEEARKLMRYAFHSKPVLKFYMLQGGGNQRNPSYRRILAVSARRWMRIHSEGHGGLASLDLGAAIMRQAAFVGSMEGIGWLATARWTDANDPHRFYLLQKAVARYREFPQSYIFKCANS